MPTAAPYRRPSLAGLEASVANPYGGVPQEDVNELAAATPTFGQRDFDIRHAMTMALADEDVAAERVRAARYATPEGKAMQDADATRYNTSLYNTPQGYQDRTAGRARGLYEAETGDMKTTASAISQAYDFNTPVVRQAWEDHLSFPEKLLRGRLTDKSILDAQRDAAKDQSTLRIKELDAATRRYQAELAARSRVAGNQVNMGDTQGAQTYLDEQPPPGPAAASAEELAWSDVLARARAQGKSEEEALRRVQELNLHVDFSR